MARQSDDIINGKEGDDLLYGEEGNDTYIINRNMGNDIIFDKSGTDTLLFADGITYEDIEVWYENNDLKVWVEGSEITLTDWYRTEHRIEILTFANGDMLDINEIINLQYNEVKGVSQGTIFDIDDGDETVYYGQNSNDIYRIGTYTGTASIVDAGGMEQIEFEEDIIADMVTFSYYEDDLIIEVEGTTVTLSQWYKMQNRIETFHFADGTVLDAKDIIDSMATDTDDTIRSLEEGSLINSGLGDDMLTVFGGGGGDDVLIGGEGNDTYLITKISGVDTIEDSLGIDTLRFGSAITSDNLCITWIQGSDDVHISLRGSNEDSVILKNWYVSENRIERVLFEDGTEWNEQDIIDAMGSNADDVYNGFKDRANIIDANDGNDVVSVFGFNDTIYGGAGNDALDAGNGDDILIGEEGDDLLFGGAGDDTYFFNRSFGKDMIFEDSIGNDCIVLGAGITYDDVIVRSFESDNNLYVALKEDGKSFDNLSDVITIKNWFLNTNRIESISFDDGNKMSLIDIMHSKAAEEGQVISALSEGGMLMGTDNEDTFIGNKGDDFIFGFNGDDNIIGAEGNDTLVGGQGDDLLEGSEGNDIYFFGRDDGSDTIYDNVTAIQEQYGYITDNDGVVRWSKIEHKYSVDGGADTVYFGEGITTDDLSVKNDGFDLVVTFKDSFTDILRIQDYYKPFNTIEFFGFSDEAILSSSEFEALLFTSEDDDVTFVDNQDRILNGNDGNDNIYAGSGNDIIDGARGDDTLNGGFGDDVYLFGFGSGHDIITDNGIGEWWQTGSGSDTIFFKDGVDRNNLLVKEDGSDLLIAIQEEGKNFEELSDMLRIVGILDENTSSKSVAFANGVNISVATLLNQVPTLNEESVSVILQDIREQTGNVEATDADGDTLNYTVTTQAGHGTLSVDAHGEWIYSVEGAYIGTDFAVITVDDGQGGSVIKTLNFDAQVSAPEVIPATFDTLEDTAATGTLSVVNPVGGVVVYEVLSDGVNGDFELDANGNWNYKPNTDYNGNDTVTLKVINEYGLNTTSTLLFDIEAVDDAPTVQNPLENVILKDGVIYETKLNATDIDGDILNYTISSMPQHGDIFIDKDGLVKYSVDTTYRGADSVSIAIDDGHGLSAIKTFNFTIDNHVINDDKNRNKLYGTNATDIMNGLSGNDRLYGYDGDDFIYGGIGKDKIYGAQGNDTLVGGVGNDVLEGYSGSDIYYFNKGDGNDTIEDYSQKRSNDIDKIVFGKEVSKEDISFTMNHGDLLLQYGDNDTIKVKYQDSQRNQIERIELSDGNYLTNDDIDLVIQQINAYGSEHDICHISNKDIQDNAQLMNIVVSAWNI